jgi:hypothetical protein
MTGKVVDGRLIGTLGEGNAIDFYIYYGESGEKRIAMINMWNSRIDLPISRARGMIDMITSCINTEGNFPICPICGKDVKESVVGDYFICDTHAEIKIPNWEKRVPRNRDD